jgi:hypothetical protein
MHEPSNGQSVIAIGATVRANVTISVPYSWLDL